MGYFKELDLASRLGEPRPVPKALRPRREAAPTQPVEPEPPVSLPELGWANFSYKKRYNRFGQTYRILTRLRQIGVTHESGKRSGWPGLRGPAN